MAAPPGNPSAPAKGRRGAAKRSDRFLHCEGWAQNSGIPNGLLSLFVSEKHFEKRIPENAAKGLSSCLPTMFV